MDHRYNYFQQNPNSLVNGQSSLSQSSVDGTQLTNNYSGSVSSMSSQEKSPFHETKHTIPNAVPLMNNFYQMDPTNQLPRSSGPPRTNAKGVYENPQSSIPNVMNLAQSNAENYPFDPDFQLQPHLTGLLPQQSKKAPEQLYSVDKFSSNRGSIAANMNTNYFSANKPYPEPKIIEYDVEDTSTESSPQHTSSLYSESTDQDSESIHPSNNFSRHTLNKNIDCHVTKESKTIMSSNQELPVPSQFADLSLSRDDEVDDQHSILHSAYNQDDDDIIEDIPLVDNINHNEIDYQKNPKSQQYLQCEQNLNILNAHAFNYYGSKNDVGPTEFSNENKQSSSPSIFNNTTNYSPYNINSSNIQNARQLHKESYSNHSNTLTQPTSSNNSVTQSQNKSSFPYENTALFSHQQEQSNIQNYSDGLHLENYNQQSKHIQPVFQNSNVSQIDSKLHSNDVNSFTQDKRVPIPSISSAQAINDQSHSQSMNSSCSAILYNQQNVQTIAPINQHFRINNSSSTSTHSVSPITSAFVNTPTLRSSSTVSESLVSENQNTPHHTNDSQASSPFNLSVAADSSPLINQDSKDIVQSELNIQLSQSNNYEPGDSQLEKSVGKLEPIKVKSVDDQLDSVESIPSPPIRNFTQPNNFCNSQNVTSQQGSDSLQPLINQFTHLQYDDLKTSNNQNDQFLNNQNSSVQESIPTTTHSIIDYFTLADTNNQSIFNQQSPNLQSHQQQNALHTQDIKPIVSSLPPSDKPNNFMTYSNAQNTPVNILSSDILPPSSIKKELESNFDNSNTESSENTKIMKFNSQVPDNKAINDQFSNMTVDNQENIRIKQESPLTIASFHNISSTVHSSDSTSNQLSEANYIPQSVSSTQTNVASLNPNTSSTYQTKPLLSNNQIIPNEKQTDTSTAHQFPPQQFNTKRTSEVLPETNQLPSQVFSSEPKSDASPSFEPNQYPTQLFNSQSGILISSDSNQLPSQTFSQQPKSENIPSSQSISNPYQTSTTFTSVFNQSPPKIFSNQTQSTTITSRSSESNQFPSQMVGLQHKSATMPPHSTGVNQQPLKLFDNQSISSAASSNVLAPNRVSNESKSVSTDLNQLPSKLNNQSIPSSVQPISSAINPIPSQMFNSSAKTEIMSPFQPVASSYPVQSYNNKSVTQNTISPVSSSSNHTATHQFGNQPKPGFMLPQQPANSPPVSNQPTPNMIPPVSPTASQLPTQMFNYQSKLNTISQQTTSNQYPSQSYNNQPRSNMVPPGPPVVNQLPPQMLSNQIKSDAVHSLQSTASLFPSQPMNNLLTSNTVPSVSSSLNHLSPQVFSNHTKPDVSSFPSTPSQYQSQPTNNVFRPNMIPPVSSTANLFPSQMLPNQPRLNAGPSNKLATNQYSSQLLSNQPISNIQPATNQYPTPQFNNQPKPNIFPPPLSATNQYPPQSYSNQSGQQMISKPNVQPSSINQLYSQTNLVSQPAHNQWPPHPSVNQLSQQSNQSNPIFTQSPMVNSSSNLPSIPPNVNKPTQIPGSQILPPNPLSPNNYYNQVQSVGNFSQPSINQPGQNVQLASKGFPQQSNMNFSTQANYQQQQPNAIHTPQGFQQQDPYKTEHNSSTVQQGFTKTWGYDNLDLLKSRDVLPGDGVQPPEIKLPQGYANCDNCSPDIFRCTMNKFPSSKNLLEKSRLPLGILIHPYKDLSRLTVIQCETITRCRNCRSYINPFVQFIDNAHWKCNLCYRVNELPGEFQIDPYTKTLGDPSRRPEIQNATIEYIASQDYMVRPPQPALYLFLLDVSRLATLTGYLEIVCDRILNKIMTDDIPGDSRTNIGFITYDSSVHFYRIANGDGGQPKQLVISDISDIFLPLPDGLMVNLEENKAAIKDLLINLPNHFRESYNTGCALGAALQAAFKLLAPRGGRVTVFQSSLPNCGPGSLQPRDDGNPHSGDRVQHMTPSTDFYKKLALECSAEQIAVDMFFISSQYLDIATISGISKYSAGCIHNFSQFDVKSPTMVTRFINCFDRYLSRKIGFEALLRLRCTRGVSIHSFHGNFFVRSYDLLMLPNVNPDNAYGMQLSIEDNLEGVSVVCFQAALLYTSSNAERRIRVHTLCIPVTDNLNDIFHNADQQAISCLIAKMAVDRSTEKSLSDAREAFFNAISDSLSAFKLGCSSYSGPGTMLSPLSLRVFPLYILATLKHTAFRTNQPTRLDDRMFSMCQMKSLPLNSLIQYLYPDLYPIHTLEEQPKIDYEKLTEIPLPPVLQLSAERVESNGIYLMDDSETLTIFIGHRCSDQLIQKLFGYVNVTSMPELITILPEIDSKPSYLLRSFISYIQHFKPYPLPIEIIKDNGPHKLRFYSRLVEDKFESSLSYYEFLQRLSQQVR